MNTTFESSSPFKRKKTVPLKYCNDQTHIVKIEKQIQVKSLSSSSATGPYNNNTELRTDVSLLVYPNPMQNIKSKVPLSYKISESVVETLSNDKIEELLKNLAMDTFSSELDVTKANEEELFQKCVAIKEQAVKVLSKKMEDVINIARYDINMPEAITTIRQKSTISKKKAKYANDQFKTLESEIQDRKAQFLDAFKLMLVKIEQWSIEGRHNYGQLIDADKKRMDLFISLLNMNYIALQEMKEFIQNTLICPFCIVFGNMLHFTYHKTKSNWKKHLRKLCFHKPAHFEALNMQTIELLIKATSGSDQQQEEWMQQAIQSEIHHLPQQRVMMIHWCFKRLECRNPFIISKTLFLLMTAISLSSEDMSSLSTNHQTEYKNRLTQLTKITGYGVANNTRVREMTTQLMAMLYDNVKDKPEKMMLNIAPLSHHGYVFGNHVELLEATTTYDPSPVFHKMKDEDESFGTQIVSKVKKFVSSIQRKSPSPPLSPDMELHEPLEEYLKGKKSAFSTFKQSLLFAASSKLSSIAQYLNDCLSPLSAHQDVQHLDRVFLAIEEVIQTNEGRDFFQHHQDYLEQFHLADKAQEILVQLNTYRHRRPPSPLVLDQPPQDNLFMEDDSPISCPNLITFDESPNEMFEDIFPEFGKFVPI